MATYNETIISYGNPDITRYECQNVYANNLANLREINFLYTYEMVYDCSDTSIDNEATGIQLIAAELLLQAREKYLDHPRKCIMPQAYWFAAIDSAPADFDTGFTCSEFDTIESGKCCSVVQGNMTFTELSQVPDSTIMDDWVRNQFQFGNNPSSWADGAFLTKYAGTDSGYNATAAGSDNTTTTGAPELAGISGGPVLTPASQDDSNFSWMSIAMLCFLVLSIFGIVAFIIHRRTSNRRRTKDYGIPGEQSLDDLEFDESEDMDSRPNQWIEPRKVPYGGETPSSARRVPSGVQDNVEVNVADYDQNNLEIQSMQSVSSEPFHDTSFASSGQYAIVTPTSASPQRFDMRQDSAEAPNGQIFQVASYAPETRRHPQERPPFSGTSETFQILNYAPETRQHPQDRTTFSGTSVVPSHLNEFEISTEGSEIDSWAQSQATVGSLENQEY